MRSSGGQLLPASALVALGTSLLLAVLIGLGLSELRSAPPSGTAGLARTEAASVVVPAETVSRAAPSTRGPHPKTPSHQAAPVAAPSYVQPVASRPTATISTGSSTAGAQQSTRPRTATTTSVAAASPSPSATPKRGHGKTHGHGKPTKP